MSEVNNVTDFKEIIMLIDKMNKGYSEERSAEFAIWKSRIRDDMQKQIIDMRRNNAYEVLFSWYETTIEYNELKPLLTLLDMKVISNDINYCQHGSKFWSEEQVNGGLFKMHMHDEKYKNDGRKISSLISITKSSLMPILHDICALVEYNEIVNIEIENEAKEYSKIKLMQNKSTVDTSDVNTEISNNK